MALPQPAFAQITEAHEERIFRLESSLQSVAKTTTAVSTKVDHIDDRLEEGFGDLKASLAEIRDSLAAGAKRFEMNEKVIAENRARIQKQNELELVRRRRWSKTQKAILGLTLTGLGVMAVKVAEAIWGAL